MPSAYQELTLRATKMQTWRTGAWGCETNFGQLHRCAHRRAPLQRSMQHSRAGTGAEPTQQHPTPPGPGRRTTQLFVGGRRPTAHRGGPFPVPLEAKNQQSPKIYRYRRSTDPPPVAARRAACSHAAAHFRLHAAQRSAAHSPHKGSWSCRGSSTPSHPPSPLCDRRYTWTVAALSPNGAAGRTAAAPHRTAPPYAAPHRPCGHAVLPRSGDLPQQRGEIAPCRSSDFESFLLIMSSA